MAIGTFVDTKTVAPSGITAECARREAKLEYKRKIDVPMQPGMPAMDRRAAKDAAMINASLSRRVAMSHVVAGLLAGEPDLDGRLELRLKRHCAGAGAAITA